MKRKVLSIMLIAAMAVSTLVGCGNSASTESAPADTSATASETTEVTAPTGDAFAGLPATIKDGVVKAIKVAKGDSVLEGTELIVIE